MPREASHPTFSAIAASLAGAALLASGCATLRATAERDRYLEAQVVPFVYPGDCDRIWADVLREMASRGFSLVGPDRAVAGQPPQSGIASFLSQGYRTRESPSGGIEAASDWNRSWVRLRAEARPVENGCTVVFTRDERADLDDPASVTSETDLEAALGLLRRVDPAAAARVEAGIPR